MVSPAEKFSSNPREVRRPTPLTEGKDSRMLQTTEFRSRQMPQGLIDRHRAWRWGTDVWQEKESKIVVFCKIENLDQKSEDLDTEEAEDKASGASLFTSITPQQRQNDQFDAGQQFRSMLIALTEARQDRHQT
jgi:hypothetical protein